MFDFHQNDYQNFDIETLGYWIDKEARKAYYIYRLKSFKPTNKMSDLRLRESEYVGD